MTVDKEPQLHTEIFCAVREESQRLYRLKNKEKKIAFVKTERAFIFEKKLRKVCGRFVGENIFQ